MGDRWFKVEVVKHLLLITIVFLILNYIFVDMQVVFKVAIGLSLSLIYIANLWAYIHNSQKLYKITRKISFYLVNFVLGLAIINIVSTIAIFYDQKALESLLERNQILGKWIYFALAFITPYIVIISEPFTIMSGNAVFNSYIGFSVGYAGTILGILSLFSIFRYSGGRYILRFIRKKDIDRYRNFVSGNEGLILIALFIFPILPDGVICAGAGLSNIKIKKFLLITIASKFITVMSYTILVEWLQNLKLSMEILGLGGFVIIAIILVKLYRKSRNRF